MTAPKLLVESPSPGIRLVTLNRPEVMNAIDMELAERLMAFLEAATDDPEARCIVITGAGNRAFCAGFDIHEMAGFDQSKMREAFVARDPLMLRIAIHRLPVIAALNGLAFGAGALIAAAADFRIAGPLAAFKVTAIGYGDANATWTLPRLVGASRAKDILMTGRRVDAAEAVAIGLFNKLETDRPPVEAALELAAQIAAQPPVGVTAVKALVGGSFDRSLAEGWQAEHDHVLQSIATQQKAGSEVFERFLGKSL